MKPGLRSLGLGGVAVLSTIAACVVGLSVGPDSVGDVSGDWDPVDRIQLFLHDLTAAPATFVAAMKVAEDGSVTGEVAALYALQFRHGPNGVMAARSTDEVGLGRQADREVLFNASTETLMAYFEVPGGLRELLLLPGEGAAIGKMDPLIATRTQHGCRCVCTGEDPESGEPIRQMMFVACQSVVAGHEPGTPCECSGIENENCWVPEPVHPDFDGLVRTCVSGFIPASKRKGH